MMWEVTIAQNKTKNPFLVVGSLRLTTCSVLLAASSSTGGTSPSTAWRRRTPSSTTTRRRESGAQARRPHSMERSDHVLFCVQTLYFSHICEAPLHESWTEMLEIPKQSPTPTLTSGDGNILFLFAFLNCIKCTESTCLLRTVLYLHCGFLVFSHSPYALPT